MNKPNDKIQFDLFTCLMILFSVLSLMSIDRSLDAIEIVMEEKFK